MASWLKAAEDLFEVVDRKAKLAVGEKGDELPPDPTPGSTGRGSQAKRVRTRAKQQKKHSSNEAPSAVNIEREQTVPEKSQTLTEPDGNIRSSLNVNTESNPGIPIGKVDSDEKPKADQDGSTTEGSLSGTTLSSNLNGDINMEKVADIPLGIPLNAPKNPEVLDGDPSVESNQNTMPEDAGSFRSIELSVSKTLEEDAPTKVYAQSKGLDLVTEPDTRNKQREEQKTAPSAVEVQEQLDEAQGLLKSAVSTGQSKEARLARVCAGLSSRLQEYKSENAQLEELLVAERELTKSYEAHIKKLQKDQSISKGEVSRVEANMLEALSAKNAEIEALVASVDALKKQAASAEENLASLQASTESIMRNRELTETRMMQALREELAAAERRAEEERSAHNSAKLAAREREVELEQRAIEASTALARTQRTADDRASKAAELEQKVALLEVECASLNQELQDMEARVRRGQKKSPEDANQTIQVQAWQEEVERARQGQREAESKLSSMEAEVQKMRVEMAAMKRDAEHYSRQEHTELEKRYRELTDLLYYKQTQLETMASEKAAAEFQLEKEIKRHQEAQLETERNRASRRASSSWEEDTDMKSLESLPLHHRHMAGASLQLQKAAKLLDTGAVRATRFLWRYPTARIILLLYLVFVHLFLMYLLHRLQEQADNFTSKEVAESMGLFNNTLP
ncbi:PREDICTED: golgin candidate 1 [Erythranthe guttata]|nr:PREDICTED: golgin candidate 1 [Erythranthe guttata]|eukprot:XP_012845421.1 PREDICTED: golgin candidate 1 [Erythranthe guttata]